MKSRLIIMLCVLGFMGTALQAAAALPTPEAMPLWPEGVPGLRSDLPPEVSSNGGSVGVVTTPTLTPFVLPAAEHPRAAVVVCPGGGYSHLSMEKEGYAIARWLNSMGISAFVLKYRLKEYGYPAPIRDGLQAIRLVRSRADEWHIDPHRIGVIGFSAGGHVAASVATLFDAPESHFETPLSKVDARPDFAMLIYPVITMTAPLAHKGSLTSLLGPSPAPELLEQLSLETRVTDKTPPTFLVHSSIDPTVPVQNSVQFYLALRKAGVPAEMHIYETGPHGFGLLPGHGPTSDWPKRAEEWLTARKIISTAK